MNALRAYLNALPRSEQQCFAKRCGTTLGYLRKALSIGQSLSESLAIAIERETGGAITVEELRPDVPWHVIRNRPARRQDDEAAP